MSSELSAAIAEGGQHPDVVQSMPALRYPMFVRRAAELSALPPLVAISCNGLNPEAIVTGSAYEVGALAVAGAVYGAQRIRQGYAAPKALELQEALQQELKQPVDIQRGRRRDSYALRWYGFDAGYHEDGFDPASQVEEFARLVEAADQKRPPKIIVSANIYKDRPELSDLGSRMEQSKRPVEDRYADQELVKFTIEEAKQLAGVLRSEQAQDMVEDLLAVLRQRQPNHRLILSGITSDAAQRLTLKQLVRRSIEDRLNEESGFGIDRGSSGTEFMRYKTRTSALLSGTHVMKTNMMTDVRGAIKLQSDGLMPLTRKQLGDMVTAIKANPDTADPADIETALWLYLQAPIEDADSRQTAPGRETGGNATEPIAPSMNTRLRTVQPTTFPWLGRYAQGVTKETATLTFRHSRIKQALGALLIFGGLSGAAMATGYVVRNQVDAAYAEARQNLKKDHPGESSVFDSESVDRYWDEHPSISNRLYQAHAGLEKIDYTVLSATQSLGKSVGLHPENLGLDDYTDSWLYTKLEQIKLQANLYGANNGDVPIGDVDDKGKNIPVWKLESRGGASSTGYWNQSVAPRMGIGTSSTRFNGQHEENAWISFQASEKELENAERLDVPDVEAIDPKLPQLLVHGEQAFFVRDALEAGRKVLRLPVLDGTVINGLSIYSTMSDNRQKISIDHQIYRLQDGTYQLVIPHDEAKSKFATTPEDLVSITYVLQKDALAPKVRAVGETTIYDSPLHTALTEEDRANIWQAAPGRPTGFAPTDAEVIARSVRNRPYSFTPLADAGKKSRYAPAGKNTAYAKVPEGASYEDRLVAVGQHLASLESANCNTAGSQLLLMSEARHNGKPLNMVTGFLQPSEDGSLSTRESHAYTVDSDGRRIDPTPASDLPSPPVEEPEEVRKDSEIVADALQTGALGIGGIAAIVAGGFASRRGIRSFKQHARQRLESELFPEDENRRQELALAVARLKWLNYSKSDSIYDDGAIRRSAAQTTDLTRSYASTPAGIKKSDIAASIAERAVPIDTWNPQEKADVLNLSARLGKFRA